MLSQKGSPGRAGGRRHYEAVQSEWAVMKPQPINAASPTQGSRCGPWMGSTFAMQRILCIVNYRSKPRR